MMNVFNDLMITYGKKNEAVFMAGII